VKAKATRKITKMDYIPLKDMGRIVIRPIMMMVK
jgi:hypothetical protein